MDLHESGIIGKPFKRTSTAICFYFLIFDLEYLIRVQSSEPLHAKMNPTSCLFGSRFARNAVFQLAGALSFDEKIRRSATLFCLGCGIMEFFTCEPQSKEQLMSLPHLWSTVWRKRSRLEHMQTVNRTSRRIRGLFTWSGAEL